MATSYVLIIADKAWLMKAEATSTVCVVKISYGDGGKAKWEAAGEPRKHMAGGKTYSPGN
jgi:hypothetical protein